MEELEALEKGLDLKPAILCVYSNIQVLHF